MAKPTFNPIAMLHHERKNLRKADRSLTEREVAWIAFAAVVAVFLQAVGQLMVLARFSRLDAAEFASFHPHTPYLTIAAQATFMFVTYRKHIHFPMIYVMATLSMVSSTVVIMVQQGMLDPQDLRFLDPGWGWWAGE